MRIFDIFIEGFTPFVTEIKNVTVHPDFDAGSLENNLALIRLANCIKNETAFEMQICLPNSGLKKSQSCPIQIHSDQKYDQFLPGELCKTIEACSCESMSGNCEALPFCSKFSDQGRNFTNKENSRKIARVINWTNFTDSEIKSQVRFIENQNEYFVYAEFSKKSYKKQVQSIFISTKIYLKVYYFS